MRAAGRPDVTLVGGRRHPYSEAVDPRPRPRSSDLTVMDNSTIVIRGAREHNLQNVDLDLPRNQLIVFTGVSGSGKSSLAFDTLYAEGQRRYVESLSSYARQFLGQFQKPDVDYLGGLSPAISIQQKAAGRNPRSTVGTITEIYDYLRVLFARVGQGHCPVCGRPITAQTREQILARILLLPAGTPFLLSPPRRARNSSPAPAARRKGRASLSSPRACARRKASTRTCLRTCSSAAPSAPAWTARSCA